MSIVKITSVGGQLHVKSPYNSKFVGQAKALGGKWRDEAWVFDIRDEARVRELCRELYGSDGLTADTITLRIEWREEGSSDKGPIEVSGRPIARAFGRDSGAKLADGIVQLAGGFSSGGSVKNWVTRVRGGTIVLVRDFSRARAEELIAGNSDTSLRIYSIEPEQQPIDRDALEAERSRLQARLAEIEVLLAQ